MTPEKIVAIIPARGSSKGIPGKNIAPVGGHPLIAWTIFSAQKSNYLDRIIVTTDSSEIAEVARRYDAEVPFLRPKELAQDDTSGILPPLHAVDWLQEHENYESDYLLYLQPTSPLRSLEDINGAIELAFEKNADAVLSVAPVERHPFLMKELDGEGRIRHYVKPNTEIACRQDFPPLYAVNGAIWLIRPKVLREKKDWYTDKTYAYLMPTERSIDIDTPWDLHLADLILKDRSNS